MEIRFNPGQVARVFLLIVGVLLTINVVTLFFYFTVENAIVDAMVDYFDFAIEHNVPTFYSAIAILFCSALLAIITHAYWRKEDGSRYYWLALSLMFLFLAFDEAVAIHEMLGSFLERYMNAQGYLYFLWVVPYGIAVVFLGIVFLRFTWNLPELTRLRFIAAGLIFVTGAIGIEMLGAREADLNGTDTILYCALYTIEELMEMLGIVLFMYALLDYITTEIGGMRLALSAELPASPVDESVDNREPLHDD